jgi:hypothetical protein
MNANASIFYHGTRSPLHLQAESCIDPKFARGGDEGDPVDSRGKVIPHVYLTKSVSVARWFALKSEDSLIFNLGDSTMPPYCVYRERPDLGRVGYVYCVKQSQNKPFHPTTIRGVCTGNYISLEKLYIERVPFEVVAGLSLLMRDMQLQVFYLQNVSDTDSVCLEWRALRHLSMIRQYEFLQHRIEQREIRYLNSELT